MQQKHSGLFTYLLPIILALLAVYVIFMIFLLSLFTVIYISVYFCCMILHFQMTPRHCPEINTSFCYMMEMNTVF